MNLGELLPCIWNSWKRWKS